jgi:type I restriction enzyme S subunit
MAAVEEKLGIISKPDVRSYSEVSVGYTYFEEGDVLFAKITPCMQNGKHAIARNLIDSVGFGSTEFHVVRPSAVILPEWIHFFVRQPAFLREARSYFVGAVGQQRVPEIFLVNYHIPLPPLPEQKRIASKVQELFKEVERAHAACEAQLEAAKALPQAYLRQVFESNEAKKWGWRKLGEMLELHDSGLWGYENPKNGILIIRSVNFRNDGRLSIDNIIRIEPNIQNTNQKKLRKGDILLERSGGGPKQPVGRVVLFDLDGEFYFGNFISRLRCKSETESQFLFFYLFFVHMKGVTLSFQDQTTGIRNLRFGEYLQLPIPVPNLDIQKRLGLSLKDEIANAEKLKADIEKQLETVKALPQAILRRAFAGKL